MSVFKPTALVLLLATTLAACGKDGSPASSMVSPSPGVQTIEGTIEGLANPNTILVGGKRVVLDPGASIRSGSMPLTFSDLALGARSRVTAQSDGSQTLRGSTVEVLDPVGTSGTLHGVIGNLTRRNDAFQFKVGNQLVLGDGSTQILEGNKVASAEALRDGLTVDGEMLQRSGYAYAKRLVLSADSAASGAGPTSGDPSGSNPPTQTNPPTGPSQTDPAPTGPTQTLPTDPLPPNLPSPSGETAIDGVLGNVTGFCPLLVFPLNGQLVVTSASTAFVNGDCSALKAGTSAEVEGTPVGNTVIARQITVH